MADLTGVSRIVAGAFPSAGTPPSQADTLSQILSQLAVLEAKIDQSNRQIADLQTQLGDVMTYIKSTPAATRLQLLTSQQTGTALAAPLAVPATTVDQVIIHRTLASAATDFLFTANQSGRNIIMAFSNDKSSTANLTISAQASEIISGPASALNPAAAQTYVLQPDESLTLENVGNTLWAYIA